MDCSVVVEAAVPVYDVENEDEAIRIAISKTGEMLNPDLNYVEIGMSDRHCPHCGDAVEPAFIAADESLVALELEMTVFNVERHEHAARIARKEIGQRLENIPLAVLTVETVEDDDEDTEDENAEDGNAKADDGNGEAEDPDGETVEDEGGETNAEASDPSGGTNGRNETESDDVLPTFDELLE